MIIPVSNSQTRRFRLGHKAFSLIELMVVIMILGILAAIVVPRFASATDDARSAALQSSVLGVRSSIGAFRTQAIMAGNNPFPTLIELNTTGTVLQSEMPINPYSSLSTVQSVGLSAAIARAVSSPNTYGWNYYVDNTTTPPKAIFYANSTDPTLVSDGAGGTKTANEI